MSCSVAVAGAPWFDSAGRSNQSPGFVARVTKARGEARTRRLVWTTMSDNDADTERCTESNDQYDDRADPVSIVETPDGGQNATVLVDTSADWVRVTVVSEDTNHVTVHSQHAARVLAEELEAAADRAEENDEEAGHE